MKTSTSLAAALLAAEGAHATAGVIQWDIQKLQFRPNLHKRAGQTFEEVITNERIAGGYFATCQIGTPPQDFTLQLDTGSSDIWVPEAGARICTTGSVRQTSGCGLGSFNPSASSTFEVLARDGFNISYVDGSFAFGDYFTDTFEIGGATLQNMTMGLGVDTDIPYGLVGVGYEINEASVGTLNSKYPNLPVSLQQTGMVNTVAYSLWLNDLDASTGSILFGGIDTDKYVGDMIRVNVLEDERVNLFTHFAVALTSLTATSGSGSDGLSSSTFPIAAILDSGTTLSYLPTDLAQQVWNEVGAIYISSIGRNALNMAVLPCSRQNIPGNFTFGFGGDGGPQISVGMDELVLDMTSGNAPVFPSSVPQYAGQEMCAFGIQNFSAAPYLLGDTFLRSAYVVYDLENNEIGLARTDFNATTSNIVPFASLGASIPSSTPAPNQGNLRPSGTGAPGFSASGGFQNGGMGMPSAMDFTALALVGVSTLLVAMGSGVFLMI